MKIMKKNIIKVVLIFCSYMSLSIMCEKFEDKYLGELFVKNCTDKTLIVKFSSSYNHYIAPGDSVLVGGIFFLLEDKTMHCFDAVMHDWHTSPPVPIEVCELLLGDSILLIKWNYSDRNLSGKQFFNESSWRYYENIRIGGRAAKTGTWVFDILPEDLEPE